MNLLNGASDSRFVTRKWNIVNNQSSDTYVVGNEFIYNTEVLKSNYCDYNDTFILPRGDVIIAENNGAPVPLKKCTIW